MNADRMASTSTLESYDDFSGRAALYDSSSSDKPFPVDIIVQEIDFALAEHIQMEPHIGNTFSFIPFGKDKMSATVSIILPDSGANKGKSDFMDVYRNYWRLEAVARRGVAPVLALPNAALSCACTSLHIQETGEVDDCINIAATLAIFKAVFSSQTSSICYDYIHGTELSNDSQMDEGIDSLLLGSGLTGSVGAGKLI